MNINVRSREGVTVIDIEGNIDINASDFIETVGQVLVNDSKNILCNFAEVSMVDYVGVSVMAVAYKNVLNHKGNMKICCVPFNVKKLFTIVGLDRVFEPYDDEDSAMESFRSDNNEAAIVNQRLRRRFKRIPAHTNLEFRQKYGPHDKFYKGKVLNLSADGVFMVSDKIFSLGEILTVRLHLEPTPGMLELDAKVIWEADQQIQPLESPAMGLEFYKIDPEVQAKVVDFVEKNMASSESES